MMTKVAVAPLFLWVVFAHPCELSAMTATEGSNISRSVFAAEEN